MLMMRRSEPNHGPPGLFGSVQTSKTWAAGAGMVRLTVRSVRFMSLTAPFGRQRTAQADRGVNSRTVRILKPMSPHGATAPREAAECFRGRDGSGEQARLFQEF